MAFHYRGEQSWLRDLPGRGPGDGRTYGAAFMPGPCGMKIAVIFIQSDDGWEHVSVSLRNRFPNWDEMCAVKALFWGPEETVVQFHVAPDRAVNPHPYVLHLWRHSDWPDLLPPREYV
jgi:hypothetical protein